MTRPAQPNLLTVMASALLARAEATGQPGLAKLIRGAVEHYNAEMAKLNGPRG